MHFVLGKPSELKCKLLCESKYIQRRKVNVLNELGTEIWQRSG